VKHILTLVLLFFVLTFLRAQESDDDSDSEDYPDFGESALTITGSSPSTASTTQQMEVITKAEIERRNSQDLASLLEDSIGMSVTRYGAYGNQTDLSLRGFDTERIAILIDGVPANSPRSGEFDINQIDLSNVERIEIIYGGSDTKYNVSGALGGVINIITIKKQPAGFSFGALVSNTGYFPGRYNTRHSSGLIDAPRYEDLFDTQSLGFHAGHGSDRFSIKGSAFGNYARNHYLYRDDYGFARRKVANEIIDTGADISSAIYISDFMSLVLGSKFYYANKNYPVNPNATNFVTGTDVQFTETVVFNAPVFLAEPLGMEASLSYQHSNTTYGSAYSITRDHYLTFINRWNYYPADKLVFRAGYDWRFLYITSNSPTETIPERIGNMGGLYFTTEFSPNKPFMLIGSAKIVTDTKQSAWVPKLGWRWHINDHFTVKNNYFRSFKFPDFDDLYYRSIDNLFTGNPNLRPEDGLGFDLILEFVSSGFSAASTAYFQYTEDSIHWVKSSTHWSPENIGKALLVGIDFRPAVIIPVEHIFTSIKVGASYQFQLSYLLSGNLSLSDAYRIPYTPTHIVGGTLDLRWETGSVLLTAHYETLRFADTMNKLQLDPYCTLNLTVNQNLGSHFTAFIAVRNILNSQYESFAGYYMPGISATLGLRFQLSIK
jgi:vitamin B12 transporter